MEQKVIVSRNGWGAGLGHGLWNILVLEKYCKKFNRQLAIDWSYSNYTSKEDMGKKNIFQNFFKGIKTTVPTICNDNVFKFYPNKKIERWEHLSPMWLQDDRRWKLTDEYFDKDKDVDENILFVEEQIGWDFKFTEGKKNFFILQPWLKDKIDKFYLENFKDKIIIGVHLRHGNGEDLIGRCNKDDDFSPLLKKYTDKIYTLLNEDTKIFLCTDSLYILNFFKNLYDDKLILYPKFFKPENTGALHFPMKKDYLILKDGYKNLEDAITEMWLLSKTNFLIHGRSLFSDIAFQISGEDKLIPDFFIDNKRK